MPSPPNVGCVVNAEWLVPAFHLRSEFTTHRNLIRWTYLFLLSICDISTIPLLISPYDIREGPNLST